jgi:hypothetical protein
MRSIRRLASLAALLASGSAAAAQFDVTITNHSAAAWSAGVLAVLPGGSSPDALLDPALKTPSSGDPYDTYAYSQSGCDPAGEDDGDAALLISRWPALTTGSNAWIVGPLASGAAQTVTITAQPGDVMSFVAWVTGAGDDAVILVSATGSTDGTVDLFDGSGAPLTSVPFDIGGFDLNDCAASCPPTPDACNVTPGGNAGANAGGPQTTPATCVATSTYPDADGDGVGANVAPTASCAPPAGSVAVTGDCDDTDAGVLPGAVEVCDGVDQDCDGTPDDGLVFQDWYADADLDGYGDAGDVQTACSAPAGRVTDATDCDDTNAFVGGPTAWYPDLDGDTYGDGSALPIAACNAPSGHVTDATDCDDTDPQRNPGGTTFADADADGWGDAATAAVGCAPSRPTRAGDCDDGNAAVSPDATEVCGGGDEDCDGLVDDQDPSLKAASTSVWYTDADSDGFGDDATATNACAGGSAVGGDCDDADPGAFPGNAESCDGVDEDCNGIVDDNAVVVDWYADTDGDLHGDATAAVSSCAPPVGYVRAGDDCDDTDPDVLPGGTETCDGVDQDCDGATDEDAVDQVAWHADADADGHGDPGVTALGCVAPSGYVADDADCDDTADAISPDAYEVCDGIDDDCDGDIDEDAIDAPGWYTDADGDGFGAGTAILDCDGPTGTVSVAGDCDDADAQIAPDATEACNGVDDDCDGTIDDGLASTTFYADDDGDGFGDAPVAACVQPSGTVTVDGDCDDAAADVNPGATEFPDDGIDQDCDGADGTGDRPWAPADSDAVPAVSGCDCDHGGGPAGVLTAALAWAAGRRRR